MTGYPWYDEPRPEGPLCEKDQTIVRDDGSEFYGTCGQPGVIDVGRTLLCEDHAGELGYGPKQEEYGYDPDDGPGLGTCPYFARYHGIKEDPAATCTFGCRDEPECVTCEPAEGWPGYMRDPATGFPLAAKEGD